MGTACVPKKRLGFMTKRDCNKSCKEKSYSMFSFGLENTLCSEDDSVCRCYCSNAGCTYTPDADYDLFQVTNGMYSKTYFFLLFSIFFTKITLLSTYAPVKLFCPHPLSPPGSPRVRRKMYVIEKGGALENEVKKGRGTQK